MKNTKIIPHKNIPLYGINYCLINVFVQVLIVGGGDGGVAREVAKHPEVEEIHLCEIDEVL